MSGVSVGRGADGASDDYCAENARFHAELLVLAMMMLVPMVMLARVKLIGNVRCQCWTLWEGCEWRLL